MTLSIETNMSEEFKNELLALFQKYGVRAARGWEDGVLYLRLNPGFEPPLFKSPYWVEFHSNHSGD
jgi:hypothetical protein